MVDADHFKAVNGTMGHAAGEALLAAYGARLTAEAGPCAAAGRLGGDEFFSEWDNRGRRFDVSWLRRRGTGLTRRLAGSERTTCSIPEAGWRCSATSLSAGRENRRCMPRPPISTSGSAQGSPDWGHPPLEEDVRGTDEVGAWSTIPENCLAQRSWLSEVSGGRAGTALHLAIRRHGRLGRPHGWVSPA